MKNTGNCANYLSFVASYKEGYLDNTVKTDIGLVLFLAFQRNDDVDDNDAQSDSVDRSLL